MPAEAIFPPPLPKSPPPLEKGPGSSPAFNLTNGTINIGRNKQVPMMSPSIMAEDHFNTIGRHISTYHLGNMLSREPKSPAAPPASPEKGRCCINVPLSKKATNPKGKTNPNTVGSDLTVEVMEEASQKIRVIRDNSMLKIATFIIKNQLLQQL